MFVNVSRVGSVLVKDQAFKKNGHSPIRDLDNLTQDASSGTVPDEPTFVSRVRDADLVGSQVRELKQIDTVRRIRVKLSTVAREARRGTGGQGRDRDPPWRAAAHAFGIVCPDPVLGHGADQPEAAEKVIA
jgi:hypothetical protein